MTIYIHPIMGSPLPGNMLPPDSPNPPVLPPDDPNAPDVERQPSIDPPPLVPPSEAPGEDPGQPAPPPLTT